MHSVHVSTVIDASPAEVYRLARDPDTLPRWASGLASGELRREGDRLVVASPMGEVAVTFAAENDLGVLDHDVELRSGEVVNNPMRVLAHPDGAEVVFTIRQLQLSDEELARDAATVDEDLGRLRELIEGAAAR